MFLPPHYFLLSFILILALFGLDPSWHYIKMPWNFAGLIFISLGLFLSLRGIYQFQKKQTPLRPFTKPEALIEDGVFSLSRNPIYLGMSFGLFGLALGLGNLLGFAVPLFFTAIIHIQFVRKEEEFLEKHFGKKYQTYKKKVRQWL